MISENFTTLVEAFDLYYLKKYDNQAIDNDFRRRTLACVDLFKALTSRKIICYPTIGKAVTDMWQYLPPGLFVHLEMREMFTKEETPHVDRNEFASWLASCTPTIVQDSFQCERWTFGQTVTWIAFLSPDCTKEITTVRDLETYATIMDSHCDNANLLRVADAERRLLFAVTFSGLEAIANPMFEPSKPITPYEWQGMKRLADPTVSDDMFESRSEPHQPLSGVTLARAEILAIWPESPPAEPATPAHEVHRPSELVKEEITGLLHRLLDQWEDSGRLAAHHITNAAFIKMVTSKIPDAIRNWADIIWRNDERRKLAWYRRGPPTDG